MSFFALPRPELVSAPTQENHLTLLDRPQEKGLRYWKDSSCKATFELARAMTADYSKSFFMAACLLPKERRWATYAVYAFCRYVDNLVDEPRDRSSQELDDEIAAFTRELERAYARGESQHPIIQPFIQVALRYQIPIEYPLDLIKGVLMDVGNVRYQSFDDLYVFCYRVAGVVGLMMTHILGYSSKEAFVYAEKLGIAMQLTNILRDVQEDMQQMGRIYLPLNELAQYGLSEQDIEQENFTPAFKSFMQFQVQRAQTYYTEAAPGIPMLNHRSQYAIYAASRIYGGILNEVEKRGFNPFLGRVVVTKASKLAILFQEIIKTRLGRFLPAKPNATTTSL